MVKLVAVLGEGQRDRTGGQNCLARRQLPLAIEPRLTMVMELDEFCMACGGEDGQSPRRVSSCPDTATFLRNWRSLAKDESHASLMVTGAEVAATLAQLVTCVGCRRSVETLYQSLMSSHDPALQPLQVSPDGVVSVSREHMVAAESLANLFVNQAGRLSSCLLDWQGREGGKARGRRGGSSRCGLHSLGVKRLVTMANWLDTWDCMGKECKEEVVLLPYPSLRESLDQYLKKHSFCSECTNMVNRAYNLLVEEGQEPAKAAGEKPVDADPLVNADGSMNLYSGITACTKESHVHVKCDPHFISQLFTLAEPELSGLRQERHAKTIEMAQKEVLTCIGIALFERFQRIQQKIKEGEQTCDLLFLVCLKTLRRSLDVAAEKKRGVADLEGLCQELEDKRKEGKRERKRKRRERRREGRVATAGGGGEREDSDGGSLHSGDSCVSSVEGRSGEDKENSPMLLAHDGGGEDKENSPLLLARPSRVRCQEPPRSQSCQEPPRSSGCQEPSCLKLPGSKEVLRARHPVLSLTAMLEEEGEEEEAIPMEEIRSFLQSKEETTLRRQELRENLKRRFAALCVSGLN